MKTFTEAIKDFSEREKEELREDLYHEIAMVMGDYPDWVYRRVVLIEKEDKNKVTYQWKSFDSEEYSPVFETLDELIFWLPPSRRKP